MEVSRSSIEHREYSFEFLGWDLMVDEKLNVWLLECQRMPSIDSETKVISYLSNKMFVDLAALFLD